MSEGQRGKGGAKSRPKRWEGSQECKVYLIFSSGQLITGPGQRLESLALLKQGKRSKNTKESNCGNDKCSHSACFV